jgi:hypothetical protein
MEAEGRGITDNYESVTDLNSVFGRIKNEARGEAIYDVTAYMPVTVGATWQDAANGREDKEYAEFLVSPSGMPSLKLRVMRHQFESRTPATNADSMRTLRKNGRLETEWDASETILKTLHLNRIWLNASYDLDLIDDSLFYSPLNDYLERRNHNVFARFRIAPHRKIMLETKSIYRFAQNRLEKADGFARAGERIRPEFILFSQEFIPGITLYGRLRVDRAEDLSITDTASTLEEDRFNGNILMVPGIWWRLLNPFQVNIAYTHVNEDSTVHINNRDSCIQHSLGQAYAVNPSLYFSQDKRFLNRSELSLTKTFDKQTGRGIKIYNDLDMYFRNRKTNLLIEYDFLGDSSAADTMSPFVETESHQFRTKWAERWTPRFRTELKFAVMRNRVDTVSNEFSDGFSPNILLDWRTSRWVREFRVQNRIGPNFYDGSEFDFKSYKRSLENKLDLSLKAGRNLFARLLLNLTYLFDDKMLRYDMAEFKLTAVF